MWGQELLNMSDGVEIKLKIKKGKGKRKQIKKSSLFYSEYNREWVTEDFIKICLC